MTREKACMLLLTKENWNYFGVDGILSELTDEMLEDLTEDELHIISEDYKSRQEGK